MTELDAVIKVLSLEAHQRVHAFKEVQEHLSDRVYWWLAGKSFRFISVYEYARLWVDILSSQRPQREMFSYNTSDRTFWKSLPDDLTLYRAYGAKNKNGLYTTLSLQTALEFGYHCHGANGRIDTFHVKKQDCLYRGGYQFEVIHLPRYRAIAESGDMQ